jgi:PAS domain S-box-containing protein
VRNSNPTPDGQAFLTRYGIDVGTWELEVATRRFHASERWARMIGCEPRAVTTLDDWLARVDERDRERLALELTTHLEGLSRTFEAEYRMKHEDGSARWMRAKGQIRPGGDDEEVLCGNQEEVTEHALLQQALRGSEARFRALVEKCPDAVAVHRHGRFLYANPQMATLLGYADAQELSSKLFLEVVHRDDFPPVIEDLRRLTREEVQSLPLREIRLLRRDGGTLTAEVASLRLEFDGEPAIFAIARDVTERKRLQAQIAQSDRMASLGTLAAGVAHEINNPLCYLSSNLQMMGENLVKLSRQAKQMRNELAALVGPAKADALTAGFASLLDPATFDTLLEIARDATEGSQRVQSIVAELKHFARPHSEQRGPVDLAQVMEVALKIATHEIKHRARVNAQLEPVPPILGDEGRLCQVFINLLVNAAQAIEPGNVSANEIVVSVRPEGEEVVAEVRDTGCGIPAAHLSKLFDPFFTTKPPGVGSGLGLAICQHIVHDHQGKIEVESEVGCGTRVILRFHHVVESDLADRRPAEEEAPLPEEPTSSRQARILIVDDEPALARALHRDLSQEHEVVVAGGGEEALAILRGDQSFALILCDMMMLDVSGQDVYDWLKANCPALVPQVVFITGGATTNRARDFLESVDNVVLDKPIELKKLRRIVRGLVRNAPAAPRERRRAPRIRAHDIYGVLKTSSVVQRLAVIDYSSCGLRVDADDHLDGCNAGALLSMVLNREADPGLVQAEVKLVRSAPAENGRMHLCFEIASMDPDSQEHYRGWMKGSTAEA